VTEAELLANALQMLQQRLPEGWTVERTAGQAEGTGDGDGLFLFKAPSDSSSDVAMVVAKPRFSPVDVDRLLGGLGRRLLEAAGRRPILLVSSYLSPRTRELLTDEGISYLDLTGNVRLTMRYPAMFVETVGAQRQPRGQRPQPSATFAGPNAWRVIRFLVEVEPPYGVLDIERATGIEDEANKISRGWVSRTLGALADEALIRREPRGPVEQVDWPALLRRRGQAVDLFKNTVRTYVAPKGAAGMLDAIPSTEFADKLYLTGSFAAVRIAPIAAPALLVLYMDPDGRPAYFNEVAERFGLQEASEGGDVALLRPNSMRPIEDYREAVGLRLVNLPQLVVDCLGGTGRMPAEGEAVLDWMRENESAWRASSLDEYLRTKTPR